MSDSFRRTETLRALWPWLPLWTVVALLAIFSHGPMPLYSTRTLAVAWEMWSEHHWLVPHINGEPYSEKAPLLFWLIHAGWFAFGGVGDVWPRVLEVAFGTVQLVLAATLARRLFPERAWIAKATPWMLMALSYAFLFGLQIMYEVLLACCVLGALLALTPRTDRAEPRWWLFGLCIGLGLLTKGPVMLLHVAFPWLLGPLWSDHARAHRARWYGRGALALLLGLAMLVAWALPAGLDGGEVYRQRLWFTQTAARVVKHVATPQPLQAHAHPAWWYLMLLPVLMFPFSTWPRASVALAMLRRPLIPGLRFVLCWLTPNFVVFSLVSGKQAYYPLPEFAGGVMLIATAVALLRERHPRVANNPWLGTWPLGVGALLFALYLLALPTLAAAGHAHGEWLQDAATYSRRFGVVFLLLGALLLLRGRGEMRRLAFAGLIGTLALNMLFTLAVWHRYDLSPITALLGKADASGHAVGLLGNYEGEFHFAGRLTHPIAELYGTPAIEDFARAHPDGLIVDHPSRLTADDLRYPILVQPFRSSWLVVWPAATLADLRAGRTPPEPIGPTRLVGVDPARYRALP